MPPDPQERAERDRVGAATFVLALRARGVSNVAVLRALELVPREHFAPERHAALARADIALPLACGQTMTAPTVVAQMLVALQVQPGARVLEIGTGSGYVTALLARLGGRVQSFEIWPALHARACARLEGAEIDNLVCGNGLASSGPVGAFDRILVNGALDAVPAGLTNALAPGGRLVAALSDGGRVLPRLVTLSRLGGEQPAQTLGGSVRVARMAVEGLGIPPINGSLT